MRNYWLLSSAKDGELWPVFWNDRVVAVGWSAVGDLRRYQDRDQVHDAIRTAYPGERPGLYQNNCTQLWSFCQRVQKEATIFVRSYGAIIGIAEVQSDYEFLSSRDPLRKRLYSPYFDDYFPHIRRVRWLSLWGELKQSLTLTKFALMQGESA